MPYGEYRPPASAPVYQVQVADRTPIQYDTTTNATHAPYASHNTSSWSSTLAHYTDIGIFRDTLAPTLALNASLSTLAWAAGRSLDRIDAKDWLWPTGQLVNIWWNAMGRKVFIAGLPIDRAFGTLSWPERLLLGGVTAWATRLFYRIASRSINARTDDPRYIAKRKEAGGTREFWNKALFSTFLPEALFQTVIALPFTAPFTHQGAAMTGYHPLVQALAVGVWGTGFAMEWLADAQLADHKKRGDRGLLTEGVWSIVRHPNYLGDILIHASFPILLYGSDLLRPIELLGPLANYFFLRYIGGDAENEASQAERYEKEDFAKRQELEDYRAKKNSIWPRLQEVGNDSLWVCVAAGITLAGTLEGLRRVMH